MSDAVKNGIGIAIGFLIVGLAVSVLTGRSSNGI
jgi:hypothetical protein